jgi:hypothetical protein
MLTDRISKDFLLTYYRDALNTSFTEFTGLLAKFSVTRRAPNWSMTCLHFIPCPSCSFLVFGVAGKYCIVVSRLKPGDRFQPMRIGYVYIVILVIDKVCLSHSLATCSCDNSKLWTPIYKTEGHGMKCKQVILQFGARRVTENFAKSPVNSVNEV